MKKELKITVGVLGVGLIFGLGIGGGYYLATKNNQSGNNTRINEFQKDNNHQSTISENVDINNTLIKELYARATNYHVSKKITYDTLNDNQKVLPILNATKQNIFNEDYKKLVKDY